jgi:hypothetical protein
MARSTRSKRKLEELLETDNTADNDTAKLEVFVDKTNKNKTNKKVKATQAEIITGVDKIIIEHWYDVSIENGWLF